MDALKELHDKGMNLRSELKQFNLEDKETVLSDEDSQRCERLIAEIDANDQAINDLRNRDELRTRALAIQESQELETRARYDANPRSSDPFDHMTADQRSKSALLGWIAFPTNEGCTELQQRCMREAGINPNAKNIELAMPNTEDQRTMSTTTGSEGGYTVPTLLHDSITSARDKYNPWMGLGTRMRTSTAAPLELPTNDDTANSGSVTAENAALGTQDLSFGVVTLNGYKYESNIVKVPWELMRDSAFNMEEFIGGRLGIRIGRKSNADFTTGDGSNKANGITNTANNSGITTASNTAVTYDEWVDIQNALAEPYDENASWMFNKTVKGYAMKVKDSQNRPIFMPSLVPGAPPTILGDPYYTNPNMPTGASAKAIIHGDLSMQLIREVGTINFVRLDELYAANGQVGFVAWQSLDSELLDAGDNPVNYATFAA